MDTLSLSRGKVSVIVTTCGHGRKRITARANMSSFSLWPPLRSQSQKSAPSHSLQPSKQGGGYFSPLSFSESKPILFLLDKTTAQLSSTELEKIGKFAPPRYQTRRSPTQRYMRSPKTPLESGTSEIYWACRQKISPDILAWESPKRVFHIFLSGWSHSHNLLF